MRYYRSRLTQPDQLESDFEHSLTAIGCFPAISLDVKHYYIRRDTEIKYIFINLNS